MKIKKEQLIISIIIGIMFCILTLIIFIQFKTISYTDISALETMQETELRKEITAIKTKYTEALEKLEETNSMIKEYEEAITTDKEASVLLESELEKSRNLLGKNAVQGEGIIVTLVDVEVGKYGKITYADLIELINELKAAGAEAISINDNRIVNTSYVVALTAGYIGVNGKRIVSPYVVKAIGDITYLESGLSQKQYGYIDTKNNEGKDVTLEKSNNIFINAYSGNLKFDYAKEVEQ